MLGFLRWRREPGRGKHLEAPLVLIPVTLERASARARMYIVKHDDEPRFNTTLLELLRQDHGLEVQGLDGPLPTDAHGVHVSEIWNRVRRATVDTPEFEVTEGVSLGNASFAKHLMWKDLRDRREALRKSPVAAQLLDGDLTTTPTSPDDDNDEAPYDAALYGGTGQPAVPAREIDSRYGPAELLTPLPADGSQTAAVADAHEGRSFVLVGPPGTGKSQTIANLIAHHLGNGKTVLFASEKTAALNVVHQRLKEIGLGAHCLELHSNKSKKAEVITRLDQAWNPLPGATPPPRPRRGRPPRHRGDTPGAPNAAAPDGPKRLPLETSHAAMARPAPPATAPTDGPTDAPTEAETPWRRESEELADLRRRLNDIPERLHRRWPNGLTPYEAIGLKGKYPDLAETLELHWPTADQHTEDDRRELHQLAERLGDQAAAAAEAGIGPLDPVRRVQSGDLPTNPDEMLRRTANAALDTAKRRLTAGHAFRLAIGLNKTSPVAANAARREAAEYKLARRIITINELRRAPDTAEPWIGRIAGAGTPDLLDELTTAAEELRDTTATLSAPYRPDSWRRINGERIAAAQTAAEMKWWPTRALAERRLRQQLIREGDLPGEATPTSGTTPGPWRRSGRSTHGSRRSGGSSRASFQNGRRNASARSRHSRNGPASCNSRCAITPSTTPPPERRKGTATESALPSPPPRQAGRAPITARNRPPSTEPPPRWSKPTKR